VIVRINFPMMSELRWALLILGVVFIAALAWWERRRPRQASGALERALSREGGADAPPRLVREPPLTLPEVRVREPVAAQELPVVAVPCEEPAAARSPAEAAQLPGAATAQEDEDTMDDLLPIDPAAEPLGFEDAERAASAYSEPVAAPVEMLREALPELPPGAPLVVDWPEEHERRILALRLVAPQRERFAGRSLRQALAAEGFLLGQFAIFHKPDDERRAVLSAASLTRPGTFDIETMDSQHYGGLSLFAVLPGPKSPPQAFDELVFAARNLNERLHGVLQDERGTPLTPARIAQLREQLRGGARA
jgi:cell division protein ZipA